MSEIFKRALIVGIDNYDNFSGLSGCVNDATAMRDALSRNDDGSTNFDCKLLTSPPAVVTRACLRKVGRELFHDFGGDILFYFSGHGSPSEVGGYLITQDGMPDHPGLPMNDLVSLANDSKAKTVTIILDCCFSGAAGNPTTHKHDSVILREGVTLLAASRPTQLAMEIGGHGVFTGLVLGALLGGGADVRGRVSAASIYAYAEAALGGWDQRPMYKSHAAYLAPVRLCHPKVSDEALRQLLVHFPTQETQFRLDMTFEETNHCANPANVAIFKAFKEYQIAGLLRPKVGTDLFWTAERSGYVVLTAHGQFYHRLVRDGRI